jgi:hypothetical protein
MRSSGKSSRSWLRSGIVAGVLALAALGCSGKKPQESGGGLVVEVESDLSMPEDIDRIRVEATQLGRTLLMEDHAVGPGQLLIPTQFRVGPTGNAMPVTIRGIAYKSGQARIERSAVTPVPAGHLGKLRLPLNYLCDGTANADGTSTCGAGLTCQLGSCRTSTVAAADVPVYQSTGPADGGATSIMSVGGCFDVLACFAGATVASVEEITCTLPLPDQAMAGRLNVALALPVGGKGICNGQGCWVALDEGPDGWTIEGGRIRLPEGVCKPRPDGSKLRVVVSTACAAKTSEAPTCGAWSSVNTPIETPPPPMFGDDACGGSNHQPCGHCGTQTRMCQNGKWSDWSGCTGEGECAASDAKACAGGGTQTCGNDCRWGGCLGGACTGPTTQACGHCGTQTRTCTNGVFSEWSACTGEGVCAPGATQGCGQGGTSVCDGTCHAGTCMPSCTGPATQACGNCGTQSRTCNNGTWSDWTSCAGQGACAAGSTQGCGVGGTATCSGTCQWGSCDHQMCPGSGSQACGQCGTQTRTCDQTTLTWSGWSSCGMEGPCAPGATQPCGSGGTQTCTSGCQWGTCKGQACPPGPSTQACGNCGSQMRTCDGDTGTWTAWSTCSGEKACPAGSSRTCGNQGIQACGTDCQWQPACLAQQCPPGGTTQACAKCGVQTRFCDTSLGVWSFWSACMNQGVCNAGEMKSCSNTGTNLCTSSCQWDDVCTDHMCTKGTDCASGLCDDAGHLCVQMCPGNKVPVGGVCRDPLGTACVAGTSCGSALCDGYGLVCVAACAGGTMADASGVCLCPAGQAPNPTTHQCEPTMGMCGLGADCASDTCNIISNGGLCIGACPVSKTRDLAGRCLCPGAHELPDPANDAGCVCASGYARDGGGVCKLDVGAVCGSDGECAGAFCDATGHCAVSLCGMPGACQANSTVSCGTNKIQLCSAHCQLGACNCASGYSTCGTSCFDLQNDSTNCGSCGHICTLGQTCSSGACSCPGGVCPTVLGNGASPWGLAVVGGTLYWSNSGGSPTIASVPTAGGSTATVVSGSSTGKDMAAAGGFVFWSDGLHLFRADVADGTTKTMLASFEVNAGDTGSPYGLDKVKSDGTNVYYLTNFNVIRSVPVGGGAIGGISSGPFNSNVIDLVLTGNTLYWTNNGIWKSDFSGKMPGTARVGKSVGGAFGGSIVSGLDTPEFQLAADDSHVFWVGQNNLFETTPTGSAVGSYGTGFGAENVDMISDGINLYLAHQTSILRIPVGGGSPAAFVTGSPNIRQLAIDAANVYWTDSSGFVAKMPK